MVRTGFMKYLEFLAATQLYDQVLIVVVLMNGMMDFFQTFTGPLIWLSQHTAKKKFQLNQIKLEIFTFLSFSDIEFFIGRYYSSVDIL